METVGVKGLMCCALRQTSIYYL